jgi:hypothetical protein
MTAFDAVEYISEVGAGDSPPVKDLSLVPYAVKVSLESSGNYLK